MSDELTQMKDLKAAFSGYVEEGDLRKVLSLEEEIAPLLKPIAKDWLKEVHRFIKAQEILSLLEKNILY